MRCLPLVLLTLAAVPVAAAPAAAQPAIDRELARAYFAEAEELGRDGVALWGVDLYGPMLLVDRRSREVVANVADTVGILEREGDLYAGTLPPDVGIGNTGIDWAGRRWTMLVWPLPAGRYQRRVLVAHEMFHRVQPRLGLPARGATNPHLDTAEGRLWLRLEWRALQDALARTGEARRAAIADALLFRARRHGAFTAAAEEERALLLNEGLAEYTGIRVAFPASSAAGWAVRLIETHDTRAADASIVRNFAYATGPAYGLLLDAVADDWRSQVTHATDLGQLLGTAYGIETAAAESVATARSALYGGERLARQEDERERERAEQQARFRVRFETGPTLTLPATPGIRYSFNPNAVASYGEAGSVYLTAEVRDAWGTLRVTGGGVLLVRGAGRIDRAIVPAPAATAASSITGNGWTLELEDGWQLVPGSRPGDFVVRER